MVKKKSESKQFNLKFTGEALDKFEAFKKEQDNKGISLNKAVLNLIEGIQGVEAVKDIPSVEIRALKSILESKESEIALLKETIQDIKESKEDQIRTLKGVIGALTPKQLEAKSSFVDRVKNFFSRKSENGSDKFVDS